MEMRKRFSLMPILLVNTLLLCSCSMLRPSGEDVKIKSVEWNLISVKGTGVAKELVPVAGFPVTMLIVDDRVSGNSGCNSYNGNISIDKKTIKFGNLSTTRKFCIEGMDVESAVLNAFTSSDNYKTKAGYLLFKQGSKVMATFEKIENSIWKVE